MENQPDQDPNNIQPADNINPAVGNQSKPKKKINIFAGKEKYEIALLLIIVLVVGGAFFYLGRSTKNSKSSVVTNTPVAVASPANSPTTPNLPAADFISGNTYLNSPKKLGDLGFLKDYKALGCDKSCDPGTLDIAYYEIGSTSKSQKIDVMTYLDGPGGEGYIYAIETQPGTYSLLAQNSYDPVNFTSSWQPSLSPNATIDDKSKIDDIKMPLQVTIAGQKMKVQFAPDGAKDIGFANFSLMENGLSSIRGGFFGNTSAADVKKLGSQDTIDFYEVTAKDTDNYKVMEYHAAYKQLYSADYAPNGEIAGASGALNVNWSSGVSNKSTYFSAGAGCGSNGYVVAKNISEPDLIKVGATPGGQTLYQLPQNNPLVQETYTKDYSNGDFVDDSSLKNLTLDQFSKQHGYFLAKNGLGENVLFLRDDLIIHGGCAKPVIYLYPQQKTNVSVKVGASVVNSDPAYADGWKNVTAYPDGSLSYKNKTYGSLFWDGYGYGSYPEINQGTIVKTNSAVDTVKQQLREQGLNAQETSDFLNFWQSKLEAVKTPYIRLTWLNTAQMNQLAPLDINPRPQTLIRVFLDFQGLDVPYNLSPQKLVAPDRKGFTALEWGGLARDGLR